jgi:peptide-methionine (R)-S-oxide reductase
MCNQNCLVERLTMNRRQLLASIPALFIGLPVLARANSGGTLHKTKAEWKNLLPETSYRVLFEEDTERPGSSPLNKEKRAGTFVCAACYLPLFGADTKYESGTGWPSFFDHLPGALGTKKDRTLVWARTEYHCARCGGHQGHVFDDGPQPTGLRYCNNGVALRFVPKEEKLPALRT